MSEPEGFLARWARRKGAARSGAEGKAPLSDASPVGTVRPSSDVAPLSPTLSHRTEHSERASELVRAEQSEVGGSLRDGPAEAPIADLALPTVDLSALPPIESITATTDIRAFLAPGVPEDLKRAALRRVWTVDPAIRDFVGIAENQWDFTMPNEIAGFGPLGEGVEVGKLVAKVLGDASPDDRSEGGRDDCNRGESEGADVIESGEKGGASSSPDEGQGPASEDPQGLESSQKSILRRNKDNNAAQYSSLDANDLDAPLRGHGGALPR